MGWHSVSHDQDTNRNWCPFRSGCFQHSWVRARDSDPDSRWGHYDVGMSGETHSRRPHAALLICPFILLSPTMSSVALNCATQKCMALMMPATSCSDALGERYSQRRFSCVCKPPSSVQSRRYAVMLTLVFPDWVFVSGSAILSISIGLNAVSSNATCTAVFVAVAAVATFVLCSIPTLSKISWLAAAGAVSILVSSKKTNRKRVPDRYSQPIQCN